MARVAPRPWYVGRRVLIVAPDFLEWDLGRYLERLLAARGMDCRRFAYLRFPTDEEANARLLAEAAAYRPHVVLGLKMGRVFPETVRALRCGGALVALWFVDCFDEQVPPVIGALFREVDVFFTTAYGMLPRYRALAPTPAYWVVEGAYLPAFRAVPLPPAQRPLYASQVAFVGNIFQPPVDDPALALRRFSLLSAITERHQLKVWGVQGDPETRAKWANRCPLIDWPAFHEEVVKVCQAADVVLGINTVNTVERYCSNRTYVTLSSGGFHLTHHVPGLETMFEDGRHLAWYRSDAECLELLDYYLPREQERWRIAREGQRWARRRYGMGRSVGRILRILGRHLGESDGDEDEHA
jgi:hypothetical protein